MVVVDSVGVVDSVAVVDRRQYTTPHPLCLKGARESEVLLFVRSWAFTKKHSVGEVILDALLGYL